MYCAVSRGLRLVGHIPLISKRSLSLLLLSNPVFGAIGAYFTVAVRASAELQKIRAKLNGCARNHLDDAEIGVLLSGSEKECKHV